MPPIEKPFDDSATAIEIPFKFKFQYDEYKHKHRIKYRIKHKHRIKYKYMYKYFKRCPTNDFTKGFSPTKKFQCQQQESSLIGITCICCRSYHGIFQWR